MTAAETCRSDLSYSTGGEPIRVLRCEQEPDHEGPHRADGVVWSRGWGLLDVSGQDTA